MLNMVCNGESGQARLHPPTSESCGGSHCGQASPKASHCGGQATIEYAVVTGVLIALMVIMGLFLTTFSEYGERLLAIIASDYP